MRSSPSSSSTALAAQVNELWICNAATTAIDLSKMSLKSIAPWLIVKCPWIPVMFLVPLCILYDLFCYIRLRINYFLRWRSGRTGRVHQDKVQKVQEQVLQWNKEGRKTKMCTARPSYQSITLQTITYKKHLYLVEIDMPDIVSFNPEKKSVTVEPMVTIGQLNDYLIGRGWTLPVVPELDDLTVGGLVMGGGIESTSHKHGLFQYICKRYEMVLADGSRVNCSAEERPELYSAIPFSYGTLGFLTAVDIDIIPYKPFIKLEYFPVHSLAEAVEVFKRETFSQADSVEGIMYSLHEGVIMSGNFVEKCPDSRKLNKFGRWYKPWFHRHVETFLTENKVDRTEYMPTYDFFHRHNRSYFWILDYIIPFGNNPIFRFLFGWTQPPKHALFKWLKDNLVPAEVLDNFVCQDFGVKIELLEPVIAEVDKECDVYPLWLCPTRHLVPPGLEHLAFFKREDLHIDVGVYGFSELPGFDRVASQRRLERFVIDLDGYVALYAETQLTRAEFDDMLAFPLRNYDRIRKELQCEDAFPHIYDKISRLGRKPLAPDAPDDATAKDKK